MCRGAKVTLEEYLNLNREDGRSLPHIPVPWVPPGTFFNGTPASCLCDVNVVRFCLGGLPSFEG